MFNKGKVMSRGHGRRQCGDPNTAVGVPICCDPNKPDSHIPSKPEAPICLFANEVMDFNTAKQRCAANGGVPCSANYQGVSTWP